METGFHHIPVLLQEVVSAGVLACQRSAIHLPPGAPPCVVDLTLGGGGHASALLACLPPQTQFHGWDRDPAALAASSSRLASRAPQLRLHHGDFRGILGEPPDLPISFLCADLGVSSPQLDTPERGFSFQPPGGPLDMRMDQGSGQTAQEFLAAASLDALTQTFRDYGEEPKARPLAAALVRLRESPGRFAEVTGNSARFAQFVKETLAYPYSRTHPATRVFQALRIQVNSELASLAAVLAWVPGAMAPGGTAAFITFHSLEDRLVKHAMQEWEGRLFVPQGPYGDRPPPQGYADPRKGLVPREEEVAANPRARSSRLRCFVFEEPPRKGRKRTHGPEPHAP